MLSDWEVRRLAEIEQGLREDFAPRRLGRLLRPHPLFQPDLLRRQPWPRRGGPWLVLGMLLDGVLIALVVSAWPVAIGLSGLVLGIGLFGIGRVACRHRRSHPRSWWLLPEKQGGTRHDKH